MQVLDSQERDLREATEAAEEQKAHERATQNYIRVQWWTEVRLMNFLNNL